jgi:serine protease Do
MFPRIAMAFAFAALFAACLPAQEVNEATEKAFRDATMKVAPSVVQIETSGGTDILGAVGVGETVRKGMGPTTGVVVSPDGYVITSAFNFANKPTAVFVTIPGRSERLVAKTIATDHTRMLTLIKVEANGLKVPTAVPKSEMLIGQWSIGLGRTLDPVADNPPSVSVGIISALNRIWGKAVQTDAKISPVNYGGPLVDVEGRVFGILVPASPFAEGDTAGVEWYDSGIGFAIPFEDVLAALPRLKKGKDLYRGLLGITPVGRDWYTGYSKVQTVALDSTADKAGIKSGDEIIEVDGKPVNNHAQMLHALGPKYEGDLVSVKVKRGSETKEFKNLVLSGSLTAYVSPFLGILPIRDDPEIGVEVRYVFPNSPAEQAKIKPGDRIMKIGQLVPGDKQPPLVPFSGRAQLSAAIGNMLPGTDLRLEVKRKDGGKIEVVTARLAALDTSVPESLPDDSTAKKALTPQKPAGPPMGIAPGPGPGPAPMPDPSQPKKDLPKLPKEPLLPKGKDAPAPKEKDATTPPKEKDAKKVEKGLLKRTTEARDHEYWVFVPENYDPNIAHGLIIWLHAAQDRGRDAKAVVDIWEDFCEKHHFIIVGPKAETDSGWVASESEFIEQTARAMLNEYTIDRQRVVAHGMGVGGQMAFYIGFHARDLIRGVATTSAILGTSPKDTVGGQRLAFFIIAGGKDPMAKQIELSSKTLTDKKFPVNFRLIAEMGKEYLTKQVLEELVRWIDSLDRI